LFNFIVPRLRKWDLKFHHFDSVVCNSHYTQELAEELYGLKSTVSYPKIADQYWFAGISPKPMPYFVYVGRLVNFVRETGLIIQLFNRLKLPLVVIGSGPSRGRVRGRRAVTRSSLCINRRHGGIAVRSRRGVDASGVSPVFRSMVTK